MNTIHYVLPNQNPQAQALVENEETFVTPLAIGKGKISDLVMSYFAHDLTVIFLEREHVRAFSIFSHAINDSIGTIVFHWRRTLPNGGFGTENEILAEYQQGKIYGSQKNLSHIHIDRLGTKNGWENGGIGALLVRLAIEWGLKKGCEGRTNLEAVWNSHGWYYKHGFRASGTIILSDNTWQSIPGGWEDAIIARELENAKKERRGPDTSKFLGGLPMFLPSPATNPLVTLAKTQPLLTNPTPPAKSSSD
jgi:hypothetical protein